MKSIVKLCLASFLVGFLGCTLSQKHAVKTALDVVTYACILENALLDNDTVANLCAIEAELKPALDELLKQHRMGLKKAAVKPCGSTAPAPVPVTPDAGAPMSVQDAGMKG